MINASTKVTRASAIAGLVTAALYGIQQAQAVADLPPWLVVPLAAVATVLATFSTGYQTTEQNPAPSARAAIEATGRRVR